MPAFKPLKIRFFRNDKVKNKVESKEVLVIKNIPQELIKSDLELFLTEFAEPVHIAYPRDV